MPQLTGGVAAELANRARALLRGAAYATSGIDPEYLRDAEPEGPIEALVVAGARQGCRRYASNPGDMTTAREARIERACRPYLDSLENSPSPTVSLPFRGGQCPGVNYRIDWSWSAGSFNSGPQTANRTGPLSFDRSGTGSLDCGSGGGTYNVLTVREGTGNNPVSIYAGCGASLNSLTVTRLDGQPDNCGNPIPEVEPAAPRLPSQPRREPFNPGPGIDIDIDVEVNPDFSIDIDFGTGPITIDPFADEPGGGGGGGPGGGGSDGPGTPGSPSDTGPGGDAEGEAPEGQILTGLRIDFIEPPIGGKEYAPGVYRGVCYIYMGTAEGLDHDPAGAMLKSGQFVYAEKDYLTRWSVTANMGYNLRVTPYYRAAEAEE